MKNICLKINKRPNRPFFTSVEDTEQLAEGQSEFVSQYSSNPAMFDTHNVTCSDELFEEIQPKAGTMEAPALIANNAAPQYSNRLNCYITNGELVTVSSL